MLAPQSTIIANAQCNKKAMDSENAFSMQNGDCFCMFAMETSRCGNVLALSILLRFFFSFLCKSFCNCQHFAKTEVTMNYIYQFFYFLKTYDNFVMPILFLLVVAFGLGKTKNLPNVRKNCYTPTLATSKVCAFCPRNTNANGVPSCVVAQANRRKHWSLDLAKIR